MTAHGYELYFASILLVAFGFIGLKVCLCHALWIRIAKLLIMASKPFKYQEGSLYVLLVSSVSTNHSLFSILL